MKNRLLFFLISLILIISSAGVAGASDTEVSGSIYFNSSLISSYMSKQGFVFIEESYHENVYAASGAEVTVRDLEKHMMGKSKSDKSGHFSISVPSRESYIIIVTFHEHETRHVVTAEEAKDFTSYLGHFSSDEIDSWADARLKSDHDRVQYKRTVKY